MSTRKISVPLKWAESFKGRPTNLKPMTLRAVQRLRKGDKLYVWWAKDGNLRDVRVDEVCEVEYADRYERPTGEGLTLGMGGGDIDIDDDTVELLPADNSIDWGGRGEAFFYYPPEGGPSVSKCECKCGYSCGRQCGLPIMECMEEHYEKTCEHVWDGPPVKTDVMGCRGESATCSKCGEVTTYHDMRCGP